MKKSNEIGELAKALAKAQAEITGASTDSANPFFNSKYADLHSVWNAAEPIHKYGLSVVQTMGYHKDGVGITTTLLHESGQWICGYQVVPIKKPASKVVKDYMDARGKGENAELSEFEQKSILSMLSESDPQSVGSAITYGRRYALAAILGIYQVDDDAETAMQRKKKENPKAGVDDIPDPVIGNALEPEEKPRRAWKITNPQRQRMFAIVKDHGFDSKACEQIVLQVMRQEAGVESSAEIGTKSAYDAICERLKNKDFEVVV